MHTWTHLHRTQAQILKNS